MTEDPDKNPETDSYYYMEIIMESLFVLGSIPAALEVCSNKCMRQVVVFIIHLQTIQERLPVEIHAIVDKTIAEVEQRYISQYILSFILIWHHYINFIM